VKQLILPFYFQLHCFLLVVHNKRYIVNRNEYRVTSVDHAAKEHSARLEEVFRLTWIEISVFCKRQFHENALAVQFEREIVHYRFY